METMFAYLFAFSMVAGFQPMVQHRLGVLDFNIGYHRGPKCWIIHSAEHKMNDEPYQLLCLLFGKIDLCIGNDHITHAKMRCLSSCSFRLLSFHYCQFVDINTKLYQFHPVGITWFENVRQAKLGQLVDLAECMKANRVIFGSLDIAKGGKFKLSHASEFEFYRINKATDEPFGDLRFEVVAPKLQTMEVSECKEVRVRVERE